MPDVNPNQQEFNFTAGNGQLLNLPPSAVWTIANIPPHDPAHDLGQSKTGTTATSITYSSDPSATSGEGEVPESYHCDGPDSGDVVTQKPPESNLVENRIRQITESLYDLHKNPNSDRDEVNRLLDLYKNYTGKEKPGFML